MAKKQRLDGVTFTEEVGLLIEEIKSTYLADDVPWVIGYSGGKDSTATLQLAWMALEDLPPEKRKKPVYVITTDTLVENPVVSAWVNRSLDTMGEVAQEKQMPVLPNKLVPEVKDTFWVNLIGKGYPAPRNKFRWCTERLKIKPSNKFIYQVVQEHGQCLLLMGARRNESAKRDGVFNRLDAKKEIYVRPDHIRRSESIPSSHIYTPIEDWTNDDVWIFLTQWQNPWGYDNKDLLAMYQGATEGGECPLVVDTSTQSCGDSRFGCWVCTMVEKDKSMTAMIQNAEENEWMRPLLQLRDKLDPRPPGPRKAKGEEGSTFTDHDKRDFRRMAGHVHIYADRAIPGPYVQSAREEWLADLLKAQRWIRDNGPEYVADLELISIAELQEIRRIWVQDKHELEDSLPRIYEEFMQQPYLGCALQDGFSFSVEEMKLLREAADGDDLHFELCRELLHVESSFRTATRRAGLFDALESAFKRSAFEDIEEATALARSRRDAIEAARNGDREGLEQILEKRAASLVDAEPAKEVAVNADQ